MKNKELEKQFEIDKFLFHADPTGLHSKVSYNFWLWMREKYDKNFKKNNPL